MWGQLICSARLVQVYPLDERAPADTDIDIIAIHGLDTGSPDTWIWTDPNNPKIQTNWLQDSKMLPSIVERARIFTCDWPADMLQHSIPTKLEESARDLLQITKEHLKQNKYVGIERPVLFIASCLGGTILIKALEMDRHDDDESDDPSLKTMTRGIIFLATPFLGTAFKEMPDMTLKAWALFKDKTVSTLIDYTRKPTSNLDELVRRFYDLQREKSYNVFTFWEAHETNLLSKIHLAWMFSKRALLAWYAVACVSVILALASPWPLVLCLLWGSAFPICQSRQLVDENSATAQLFERQRLNRSHVLMNKFSGPECDDYKEVAGKIKEIVRKIGEGTLLEKADSRIRDNYYADGRLRIERLSGEPLPLDQCYINLAIVEQSGHCVNRSKGDAKASPFSLFARQKVETPDKTTQVELATIFNRREGHDGRNIQPRRILIRGRAGMGKTTLCKKIVHEFTQNTWVEWNNLFDRILWVPLRNLKLEERRRQPGYNFVRLFVDEYFALSDNTPDLAKELSRASKTKTLYLLDGLDEVSQDLTAGSSMSHFLTELLKQPNVIITSRPSVKPPPDLDLELETIGFYPDQVTAYIQRTFNNLDTGEFDLEKTQKVRSFIKSHWLIQGLVRIPIQLDALCYTWADLDQGTVPDTMTRMYEAIEQKLWKKDVIRLEKQHAGKLVTAAQIETLAVEYLVKDEICFLKGLAFTGLYNDVINFTAQQVRIISEHFKSHVLLTMPQLSFLRTSDPSPKIADREYHFIHLTFQEYFAARYFVQQWNSKESLQCWSINSRSVNEIEPDSFFQEHKYTARYDILWRFVAGLLDADDNARPFIDMIEAEPLDLLGPAHQRLVMHCLSEVSSSIPTRTAVEQRLSKWLLFECKFRGTALLAREEEFPQLALENALREGSEDIKTMILSSLSDRGTISENLIKLIASWLDHQSSTLRSAAVKVLGGRSDLPEEIFRAVAARLGDVDKYVRWRAVEVLGGHSDLPKEILQAVAARLEDEHEYVRQSAVEVLGGRPDPPEEILQAVAARLGDEHQYVRQKAVKVLGGRSDLPEKILQAMAARLGDENEVVRWRAVGFLGGRSHLPEEILQAVAARLGDENEVVRRKAVDVLGGRPDLTEEILQAVAARLGDENVDVRRKAVDVLGGRPNLPEEILQAVVARLGDEHEDVRREAVDVLGGRSNLPEVILQAVAARLEDENEGVRRKAVHALGGRPNLPEEILQVVVARLGDENENVRWRAVDVLGGRSDLPEILQAVAARLGDENEAVRRSAVDVLGGRPNLTEEILQAVATRLGDENEGVRRKAVDVLGGRPNLPEEILQAVAARLGDENEDVRRKAVGVLGGRPNLPEEILQAVVARLGDENEDVRWKTVDVLGGRPNLPEEILQAVAARLEDEHEDVRWRAVNILGGRSDLPEDIFQVVAARLGDESEYIRHSAVEVLGGRPDLLEEILQAVAARLEDKHEEIRVAAEALLRMDGKLYRTVLNGVYASALCKVVLRQSFEEQLAWYNNKDGHFCVNSPECMMVFSADNHVNDVMAIINKEQPSDFPSIGLEM